MRWVTKMSEKKEIVKKPRGMTPWRMTVQGLSDLNPAGFTMCVVKKVQEGWQYSCGSPSMATRLEDDAWELEGAPISEGFHPSWPDAIKVIQSLETETEAQLTKSGEGWFLILAEVQA